MDEMERRVEDKENVPFVTPDKRTLVAVSGEIPLGKHLHNALLRVDIVRDFWEIIGFPVDLWRRTGVPTLFMSAHAV